MKYRFQHFVDISTSAESMQILTFSVGGKEVIKRCAHLFNAYKYFKLGKISIKFVPASTLPVDPLGMSYDDSDPQTVDPRDQLNPGLVRITNGEDIMTDLGGIDDLTMEAMYQAMMLDPKWYKFNLQSGFKRSAVPLYWQIGQLHQDAFPGVNVNVPIYSNTAINTGLNTTVSGNAQDAYYTGAVHLDNQYSSGTGIFQVGHRGRLGYLPTDMYQYLYFANENSSHNGFTAMVHPVPSIQTITCVLPKARKTLYYYRVYITEEVYFSGLRSIAPVVMDDVSNLVCRGINDFIQAPNVTASAPNVNHNPQVSPQNNPMNDGTDARGIGL